MDIPHSLVPAETPHPTETEAVPGVSTAVGSRRRHYLPTLDAWRAVAAFLVVGCHAIGSVNNWHIPWTGALKILIRWQPRLFGILNGSLGVDFFFALSGFLITYLSILEANSSSGFRLGAFWIRRTFRIVPLAWLYTSCFLILTWFGWHNAPIPKGNVVLASYLFYINYILTRGEVPILLGHLWTLGLEMQFYFLWAVVLKLCKPRFIPIAALIGISLVILIRATSARTGIGWDGLRLESRGDSLLWGAVFGSVLASSSVRQIQSWLPCWLFTPLLLLLVYVADQHPRGFATSEPFLCAILVTLTVIHASKRPFLFMESRPLLFLGRISFSIYIWQQLLTGAGAFSTGTLGTLFFCPPWSLIWLVPLAWISYRFIELPGMRLGIGLAGASVRRV
ncbi:MAG TPA: acyltransferase [Chthoniobacteraceae bacterium]|nr:acyltransferase [Chthoniobacteraceae bacterium]